MQIAFENALQRNALDFIITESLNNLHQMCTSLYAYRVIQQIIEHGTESQKSIIMRGIYPILPTIIHDRYGNFVAQRTLGRFFGHFQNYSLDFLNLFFF